jgi:hypothetical protein
MARKDGKTAGVGAASWCIDGNTTTETYRTILRGIEDGDPAILDQFNTPNLSGEYAGDSTPQTLAEDYGIDETRDPDGLLLDEACTEWEEAASSAFWTELERSVRYQVEA